MDTTTFTPQSNVAEIVSRWPQTTSIFLKHRMSCVGCSMSVFESLEDAAHIYGVPLDSFFDELHRATQSPAEDQSQCPGARSAEKDQPMTSLYTFFPEISESITNIPIESIVSRTIYRDDQLKAIVFAFAPGQELSEHTASVPAIIQILEGECELVLGEDHFEAKAGAWAQMPAKLPHSLTARTAVKMLLLMLS